MCRTVDSGTPAKASWRPTPLPQSMTYASSFAMITCAGAELALLGRGPPPVLVPFGHDTAALTQGVEGSCEPASGTCVPLTALVRLVPRVRTSATFFRIMTIRIVHAARA